MKYLLYLLTLPFTVGILPADKAIEAAYIQTGTADGVDKVQSYFVNRYAKPVYLDQGAAMYWVYKRRSLHVPLGKGVGMQVTTNSANLTIPF